MQLSPQTTRLRRMLRQPGMVLAPGAYDCITARAVARNGFPAVYMTGGWTSGAFGYPDYGLLTMTEMVENAWRIAEAIDVPVIADADTGYGNELNVFRTVREYQRAGVAAIHLEDQVSPKRCGHLDGKELIPIDEYVAKIRAAADARHDPDFIIIARTDARAVAGLDEAIRRANAALESGADVAFVEAPQTMDEIAVVPRQVRGPCLLNIQHGGKTPPIEPTEAEAMGYKIGIVPALLVTAVIGVCDKLLAQMRETGRNPKLESPMALTELFRRCGADEWESLRSKFRDPTATE